MAAATVIRTIINPQVHRPRESHGRDPAPSIISSRTRSSSHHHHGHRSHHHPPDHRQRDSQHHRVKLPEQPRERPHVYSRSHGLSRRRNSHPPSSKPSVASAWSPIANSPSTNAMNKIAQLSHSRDRRHEYDKEHVRELDFVAHYKDDRWSQSLRLGKPSPTLGVSSFELIKTLGTGTFARVWLARLRDGSSGRKETNGGGQKKDRVFALKILRKVDIIKLKQVEHVRNERCTLGAVSGFPFITTLITTFVDNESLYMLLDYCAGGEIFTYLRRAGRFSEPTARFYAAEITLVLEHLHERGIAYRDLKPENMLLDGRGHLRLVDFGFAKRLDRTETYTLCGTPEYLAPEVIHNTGHNTAVDWWALGILLYEFLVGQPPFWDANPVNIYAKIVRGRIPFPPEPSSHSAHSSKSSSSSSKEKITMSRPARDLISQLCTQNPSHRLGNIAGGASHVRSHPFFDGIDWTALLAHKAPGPIVPKVTHAADAGNFDTYPDPPKRHSTYNKAMRDEYEFAFRDF